MSLVCIDLYSTNYRSIFIIFCIVKVTKVTIRAMN
jgi:hypothetical protein